MLFFYVDPASGLPYAINLCLYYHIVSVIIFIQQ